MEVKCKGYVRDRHHKDVRWANCQFLIVLEQEEPSPELKALLPPKFIRIEIERFTEWYREAARKYALMKEETAPSPEEKDAMAEHHRTPSSASTPRASTCESTMLAVESRPSAPEVCLGRMGELTLPCASAGRSDTRHLRGHDAIKMRPEDVLLQWLLPIV